MSCSGLHRQDVMVDEDSESNLGVRGLILRTRQGLNPRALGLMSQALHPDGWQVLFLEAAAGRLALDLVLKGWEEWSVLSTSSSFHSFPIFHRASPLFPTAETVCLVLGQATGSHVHSCRGLFLWPGHGRSPSHSEGMSVSPQGCGSRGGEVRGGWPEGTGPQEPHLPSFLLPAQAGLGEFYSQDHLSSPQPLYPRVYPRAFWPCGFSIPGRAVRLWESQPPVPWAQP